MMENIKINNTDEKIIVSFTSWVKRIHLCANVFKMMLNQTKLPDKIVLNLSIEEFPNKENDLPTDLIEIVSSNNDKCEIYWVEKNTKPYKKLIPSLLRFPDDVIITIDDDIPYPNNFVEIMYDEYLSWDKQCPITSGDYEWENDIYTHYGGFTLVKKEFFGDYIFDLYENLYLKNEELFPFSDPIFTYAVLLNGKRYKFTEKLNMNAIRLKCWQRNDSISKLNTIVYKQKITHEHQLIRKYIKEKYNKTYTQLFDAPIFVNITTWTKRDKYLPKMLLNLQKQTLKPSKVILWLSEDEYDINNIPQHITDCFVKQLINEIRWVKNNIYCHKRHEVFKTNNDVYNFFMDDDLLYEENYIERLYESSKKHLNSISSMAGSLRQFKNGEQCLLHENIPNLNKPSLNNKFMGGLSCYPPYTFPLESFKYTKIRDSVCPKCDETWVSCWALKKNIPFNIVNNRSQYKLNIISDSDKCALWNENKKIESNLLSHKDNIFTKTIIALDLQNKAENTYKGFKIKNKIERIIISLTSWQKRINNIPTVLTSILNQTLVPDKIVLNLSIEEFPNKELDIPENVIKFIHNNSIIEVNWVDGKNTRQWKKFIPTIQKYPNDWIICIDDDRVYWNTFIEKMWQTHLKYPNNPITLNKGYRVNGYLQHCGHGTLECGKFYDYFNKININELIENFESSDTVYNFLLHKNGYEILPFNGIDKSELYNEVNALHKSTGTYNPSIHKKTFEWLENKFGKICNTKTRKVIQTPNVYKQITGNTNTTKTNITPKINIVYNNSNEENNQGVIINKGVKRRVVQNDNVKILPFNASKRVKINLGNKTLRAFLQ